MRMAWSRIALARIPHDGCLAPVDCLFAQYYCALNGNVELQVHHALLMAADMPWAVPPERKLERLVRQHQQRPGADPKARLAPPDPAPYQFFVSRCERRGNGQVCAMEMPYGPLRPIRFHLRWRIAAHRPCPLPDVRLYYQEARAVKVGGGHWRHYPDGPWRAIAAEHTELLLAERSTCGGYLHVSLCTRTCPPQGMVHLDAPLKRPTQLQLPVEDIVERHGGFIRTVPTRSVLTFERPRQG
jgi:hypothetical protein